MSGRDGFWSRVIISSRQITSDATDDPPGLSTRRMIAFTELSSRTLRICSTSVSDPRMAPFSGSKPLLPEAMMPTA
ncbi:hypothetical protein D3C83_63110 [compost metagenome]